MNKTYHELCDEIAQLQEKLAAAESKFNALVTHARNDEQEIARLRHELAQLNHGDMRDVWYWMGDGNDHLETLACPVVIPANKLRELLEAARDEYMTLTDQRAGCPACDARPGQYHNPECPAVNAFTAGRIQSEQNSAQEGTVAADCGQHPAHHGGEA